MKRCNMATDTTNPIKPKNRQRRRKRRARQPRDHHHQFRTAHRDPGLRRQHDRRQPIVAHRTQIEHSRHQQRALQESLRQAANLAQPKVLVEIVEHKQHRTDCQRQQIGSGHVGQQQIGGRLQSAISRNNHQQQPVAADAQRDDRHEGGNLHGDLPVGQRVPQLVGEVVLVVFHVATAAEWLRVPFGLPLVH